MTPPLHVRPFADADLPGVLDLWARESGWGGVTADRWRRLVADKPYGRSVVMVATDADGAVAGQLLFTPARVQVDGRPVRAARMAAPIIRRELRGVRFTAHPVRALYDGGAEELVRDGCRLVYALPEHAWLPVIDRMARAGGPTYRFASATFDCVALPLGAEAGHVAPVGAVPDPGPAPMHPATATDDEYHALWRAAASALPIHCGVLRPGALHDYLPRGDYITLEARDEADGRLVAYAAVLRRTAQLTDLLVDDPARLAAVLAGTYRWLAEHEAEVRGPGGAPPRTFKVMATPALQPALAALGFMPVDYRFAFTCCPLDPALPAEAVAPERWYVMPGD